MAVSTASVSPRNGAADDPFQESQTGIRYAGGKAPGNVHCRKRDLATVEHQGRRPHLRQ